MCRIPFYASRAFSIRLEGSVIKHIVYNTNVIRSQHEMVKKKKTHHGTKTQSLVEIGEGGSQCEFVKNKWFHCNRGELLDVLSMVKYLKISNIMAKFRLC